LNIPKWFFRRVGSALYPRRVEEIVLDWYTPELHGKPAGRPRRDDAERTARFLLRPPVLDDSTLKRRRDSERALFECRRTPIPSPVTNTELVRCCGRRASAFARYASATSPST
jgi:hypothetical protein